MNQWSMEEIEALKSNWTTPPDLFQLRNIIQRSSASIYEQAAKLGLPKLSYKETIRIKTAPLVADKKVVFLETYKECRYERPALKKSAVAYETVRTWMRNDKFFRRAYEDVTEFLKSTKKCVYCGLVDEKVKFRTECKNEVRATWKTGICLLCDSKRSMRKSSSSLQSHMRKLWKSCKQSTYGKKKGRNVPSECTISPDDLMCLHSVQGGRCYYTGLPMSHERICVRDRSVMSVDRKDPKIGYTMANVVLCTWGANQLKRDLTSTQFVEFCKLVSARFP